MRALVSPDGQRTKVTLDGAGRASRVEDVAGRFVEVAYGAGGQVSEWKDENGNVTAVEWDEWGNLAAEVNAKGARKRFERGRGGVKMTSPEGRETLFLQGGGGAVVLQTRRNPDGTESHAEYRPGLQRFTAADEIGRAHV